MDWAEIFKHGQKFFPRWEIIDADEGGLLLRCGKLKRLLSPGIYFCWPYIDEITKYTSSLANLNIIKQSVSSKDKKSILASWSATYLVHEAVKSHLQTDDIEHIIAAALSARVVEYIGKHDYNQIKPHLIKNYLLQERFILDFKDEWGINIVGFFLRDLGLHRIIRLVSQTEPEE